MQKNRLVQRVRRLGKADSLWIYFLVIILTSCQPGSPSTPNINNNTQVTNSLNTETAKTVPTLASFFAHQTVTPTPLPSSTPLPTPTEAIKQRETNYISVPVYSDGLDSDWEIIQNSEVAVQQTGRPNTYEGRAALEVTPLQDFGELIFVLKPEAQKIFLKSNVLALVFWISGGPNFIATDDLGNTILGSNEFPYWLANDRSAWDGPDSPFSETRLYYLGLNNAVPPDNWAEVVNWLDDRQYDPDYQYVTGFIIKNDEGFLDTYYIDEIELLLLEEPLMATPASSDTANIGEETANVNGTPSPTAGR